MAVTVMNTPAMATCSRPVKTIKRDIEIGMEIVKKKNIISRS